MEERKRTIFAVLIALILVVALLYSFGPNLFYRTPQVDLADPNAGENGDPTPTTSGSGAGVTVEVTPATVQSVIASMSRYECYDRTITVTYSWGDYELGILVTQVWTDGGWTRTLAVQPSGLIEHTISGEGRMWLWYGEEHEESEQLVYEGAAEDISGDLLQRLPTYEDILDLDAESITAAGYVLRGGQPCIYVEAEQQSLGYLYRYWISETSGLLMAAETEKSGVLVYSMESNKVVSPMSAGGELFTLPDGTVLYEPS